MPLLFSLVVLVVMIAALVDLIMRDESQVRHLPKFGWIILVVLLPLIGSILWFALGREYSGQTVRMPRARPRPAAEAAMPYRSADTGSADTRSTEQQLADLDREIEEYRLRAEIERRKRESGEG